MLLVPTTSVTVLTRSNLHPSLNMLGRSSTLIIFATFAIFGTLSQAKHTLDDDAFSGRLVPQKRADVPYRIQDFNQQLGKGYKPYVRYVPNSHLARCVSLLS